MASKAERRQQARREKKRLKDQVRQTEARERRRASRVKDPSALADLPLGECYASENWHEPGAQVWAAISRRHPNDQVSAALYRVDLAAGTLLTARVLSDVTPSQLEGELGRVAGADLAVLACEPSLVAALVYAVVPGAADDDRPALRLLGDLDPDECPHDIVVGAPPPPETAAPKGPGLLARLQGWLRRAPPADDGDDDTSP